MSAKTYAVIESGIVKNKILLKDEDHDDYIAHFPEQQFVEVSDDTFFDIGYKYQDGQFIEPTGGE